MLANVQPARYIKNRGRSWKEIEKEMLWENRKDWKISVFIDPYKTEIML
jgi:hypothetical protein